MASIFATTADDQTVEIPAGIHVGHLEVNHQRCRFVGAGRGRSVILAAGGAGQVSSLLRATIATKHVAISGVCFDAANLPAVTVPLEIDGVGVSDLSLDDVGIVGTHHGATAIDNRGRLDARGLFINGDGGAIRHAPEARSTIVTGVRIHGGRYGFVHVTGGPVASQPGIAITGLRHELYYWANPRCEATTVTAVGANWVDVAAQVNADRHLYDVLRFLSPLGTISLDRRPLVLRAARRWDRVETADGHWSQVLAVATDGTLTLDHWHFPGSWRIAPNPGGRATVYRVSLGCLFAVTGAGLLRLEIATQGGAPTGHWRGVEGGLTPPVLRVGSRLDIIRVATHCRDVDTGGILCGESALAPVFADCTVVGGWSDGITVYGTDAVVAACRSFLSQDMALTLGAVRAVGCLGAMAGRHGFSINGTAELVDCRAVGNGLHRDGPGGYGVDVNASGLDAFLDVICADNFAGAIVGARTVADEPWSMGSQP